MIRSSNYLSTIMAASIVLGSNAAHAQSRLPEVIANNRGAAVFMYTCLVKLQTYARLTASAPDAPYKPADADYAAALSVGGLDIPALKAEILKDKEAWGSDKEKIRSLDTLLDGAAEKEFNSKAGQSWAQAAQCGLAIGQLKLYEAFPIKPRQ